MEHIEIQKVTFQEIELIQKISRQTFYETFSSGNTEENMARYLEVDLSLEKLTAELNTANSTFYFAVKDQKIIGYLKLNVGQSQTDSRDDAALEIERVYVLQEYHGQKVGQVLLNKALQVAEQISAPYVWLGVWEENHRAIRFYKKNGFVEFDKHIFNLADDEQIDIMMKKVL